MFIIASVVMSYYITDNNKNKNAGAKTININEFDISEFNMKSENIALIYQWNILNKNYQSDTFYVSSDSTIGFLKRTLALHSDINPNSILLNWVEDMRSRQVKVEGVLVDSFKIISKEILISTKSKVFFNPHVTSSSKDFFQNLASYILKEGDNYLLDKLGKKQISLYSYLNVVRTTPIGTNFFQPKKPDLDEERLIKDYLNFIQYKEINYNYSFKILGNDSLTLKEAKLKNFDVIQHFTINFILLYPI